MLRLITRSAVLLCALLLASCFGSSSSSTGINIYVADAPIDNATSVAITLTGVHLTGAVGTQDFIFPTPLPLNFYQLQAGLSAFLINFSPPPGQYTGVTLDFSAPPGTLTSNITLVGNATPFSLYIPSSAPTSISVPANIIIPPFSTVNITVDLDLRRSIYQDPNNPAQYILQPALRVVDNADAGNISGTVALTRVTSGCTPAVYVYSGNVTPADVNINAPAGSVQPISTALVALNGTTVQYNFTDAFLPAGLYTLAFTCQAAMDDPTRSDNLSFTSVTTTTVTAGQTDIVQLN